MVSLGGLLDQLGLGSLSEDVVVRVAKDRVVRAVERLEDVKLAAAERGRRPRRRDKEREAVLGVGREDMERERKEIIRPLLEDVGLQSRE